MSREPDRIDEMKEFFRQAAANEMPKDARQPQRRRFNGRAFLVAAMILVGAGGVAAATGLIHIGSSTNNPEQPNRNRPAHPDSNLALTVKDPNGRLPFGVLLYRARSGAACAEAGQVLNGRLGELHGTTFHPYASSRSGACGNIRRLSFVGDAKPISKSFIYYGRAREDVAKIRLTLPDGMVLTHEVGPGGAFLFVLPAGSGLPRTAALDARGKPVANR